MREICNIKQKAIRILRKFKWEVTLNLPKILNKELIYTKNHVEFKAKLNCNLTNEDFTDFYDNYDRPFSFNCSTWYIEGGTYNSDRTGRKGGYYKAGVLEMVSQMSVFDASLNVLTGSAYAELCPISGCSAGINFSLAEIKINAGHLHVSAGIKFHTCISDGVDGFRIEFLGNGISIGPYEVQFKTTFVDISINLNSIVGLVLIAVSEIISSSKDGVDPTIKSLFENLLKEIKKVFSDYDDSPKPPPPAAGAALILEEKQTVYQKLPVFLSTTAHSTNRTKYCC